MEPINWPDRLTRTLYMPIRKYEGVLILAASYTQSILDVYISYRGDTYYMYDIDLEQITYKGKVVGTMLHIHFVRLDPVPSS